MYKVLVGGFSNFLSIYNLIITARILLSWFPAAQGVGLLQPVYAITDPYLNLFRGLIPPIFGLDLSPLLAFFLLNVLGNATAALGAEIPVGRPVPQSVFDNTTTTSNHHGNNAQRASLLQKVFGKKDGSTLDVVSMNY